MKNYLKENEFISIETQANLTINKKAFRSKSDLLEKNVLADSKKFKYERDQINKGAHIL